MPLKEDFDDLISQEKRACLTMQGHRGSIRFWSGGRNRSKGKARQDRVNSLGLADFSESGRLWGAGAVLSCLVPGPSLIQGRGSIGLVCELDKEMGGGTALDQAICT